VTEKLAEWRRVIGSDEFFYVVADNYDEHIELAIPFYRMMHDEMVRCVTGRQDGLRFLDLGAGTGKTAAVLLINVGGSTARLVELFGEMLKHARTRLAAFGNRVEYVQGDFMDVPLGDGYDICVSSLAIHHQNAAGKQRLFNRVFEALGPHGKFLMIDWTKFSSSSVQELAAQTAEQHASEHISDAQALHDWCEHWRTKNIPDTVEDLCLWLKAAGFRNAECVMRYYGMALICAEKAP